MHRALECVGNAQFGPLGHIQLGNVLAVQKDVAAVWGIESGGKLCDRGFAAAIGSGHHGEFSRTGTHIDAVNDFFAVRKGPDDVL